MRPIITNHELRCFHSLLYATSPYNYWILTKTNYLFIFICNVVFIYINYYIPNIAASWYYETCYHLMSILFLYLCLVFCRSISNSTYLDYIMFGLPLHDFNCIDLFTSPANEACSWPVSENLNKSKQLKSCIDISPLIEFVLLPLVRPYELYIGYRVQCRPWHWISFKMYRYFIKY